MTIKDIYYELSDMVRYEPYVASDGCKCCESYVSFDQNEHGTHIEAYDIEKLMDKISAYLQNHPEDPEDDGALENE